MLYELGKTNTIHEIIRGSAEEDWIKSTGIGRQFGCWVSNLLLLKEKLH